jgi:hypothetical protein
MGMEVRSFRGAFLGRRVNKLLCVVWLFGVMVKLDSREALSQHFIHRMSPIP